MEKRFVWIYLILTAISFKIVILWMYTPVPSHFPLPKSTPNVNLPKAVEDCLRFWSNARRSFKTSPFSESFLNFENNANWKEIWWIGRWGTTTVLWWVEKSAIFRKFLLGALEQTLQQCAKCWKFSPYFLAKLPKWF